MLCRALALLTVLGAAACGSGGDADQDEGELGNTDADAAPDDVDHDADAGTTAIVCASDSVGDRTGTARVRYSGSGGYTETSAEVVWTLVETTGCVDRFEPSGSATADWAGGACASDWFTPASAAIGATDGSLAIDRSTSPAAYAAHGETRWAAVHSCDVGGTVEETDGEAGGAWLKDVVGTVTDGGALTGLDDSGSALVEWSFEPSVD